MPASRFGSLIGPLASWELVRVARRGHVNRARLMVLYFILIAFVLVPILWFPSAKIEDVFFASPQVLPIREAARFGHDFAMTLLCTLLVATMLLAPGYAAAAIAVEKEQQTLPLLLATLLTDREIVLGKVIGGLGLVLGAAIGAVPVIACTALFGGIDWLFLVSAGVLISSTALVCTAIGAFSATIKPDLRSALFYAYGMLAIIMLLSFCTPVALANPFAALLVPDHFISRSATISIACIVHLMIAFTFLDLAARKLRHGGVVKRRIVTTVEEPPAVLPLDNDNLDDLMVWKVRSTEFKAKRVYFDDDSSLIAHSYLPPIDDDQPLRWKERYFARRRRRQAAGGDILCFAAGALAVIFLVIGLINLSARHSTSPTVPLPRNYVWHPPDASGQLILTGSIFATGIYVITIASALSGTVARERRRNTLDSLLTLPIDRAEILKFKVVTAIEQQLLWLIVAVLAIGVAFLAEGGYGIALVVMGFLLSGVVLITGLGSWLTVHYVNELQAFRFLLPAVVFLPGSIVALWQCIDWLDLYWWTMMTSAIAAVLLLSGIVLWHRARREFAAFG